MSSRRAYIVLFVALFAAPGCRLSYTGGAKQVNPAQLDTSWLRASATPVIKQKTQVDCGLAALAMVGGAWGQPWTVDDLRRDVKMSEYGAKLGALRDAARARGFEAYAIAGKHEDLRRELEKGRPVILGLQLPFEQKRALHHYEVVVAMNPRDGTVVTLDPATGKYLQRTKLVLEKEWKPVGYPTLVVVGPRVAHK
ncbi:MAG: cysteine peptidase family C39 domain-containing protein [Myxococcota bacterium]|nr:C39 family peptidase [Deltaproteobacteria bacterium]MDQ3339062.1 cysteine peptidase family C39 domain-containing protein [Myxococcota bacterium]